MTETLLTSLLAFISTNMDDVFILMLFFGARKYTSSQIVAGQYLGIAALVLVSFIGSYAGNFVDPRYIGWLGLFPIYLAIKQIVELTGESGEEDLSVPAAGATVFAIAGVTIANGGDNIGVYAPLITTMSGQERGLLLIVFSVMVYTWCLVARYLAHHPLLAKSLARYGHVIMPIVLFALGIFILYESQSWTLLF